MRRIAVIGYLITHTRQQLEFASITKFGIELSLNDIKNVPEIAPVIRQIPSRIFYQAHAQVTDGEGAPGGLSPLAETDARSNAGPVRHGKRQRREFHVGTPSLPTIPSTSTSAVVPTRCARQSRLPSSGRPARPVACPGSRRCRGG